MSDSLVYSSLCAEKVHSNVVFVRDSYLNIIQTENFFSVKHKMTPLKMNKVSPNKFEAEPDIKSASVQIHSGKEAKMGETWMKGNRVNDTM